MNSSRNKVVFRAASLAVLAVLILAACQSTGATPTPANNTAGSTSPTAAPTAGTATAVTAAAEVDVVKNATLGDILVDQRGMTLYTYSKDTPGVSNCSGKCLAAWPALITNGAPVAGTGVTGKLGTITRDDGSTQVTYNDMPLYFYVTDTKPGDTTGQGVGGVWYVVAPTKPAASSSGSGSSSGSSNGYAAIPVTGGGAAEVDVSKNAVLGSLLVDGRGMTLYTFSNDLPGVSKCSGGCAAAWPPLTTTGTPVAGSGVTGKLGTITRADGSVQVTYNGSPLYFFASDTKPGDTSGQEVNDVWYVVRP